MVGLDVSIQRYKKSLMGSRARSLARSLAIGLLLSSNGVSAAADWVLHNGFVYTMDASAQRETALVIEGDKIAFVGDDKAALRQAGTGTKIIDLNGRAVFPGFIDTHIHIMDTLPLVDGAMLSPSQSAEEVLAALAQHIADNPEQNPVLGAGFLARAFGIDGPTAKELDQIVSDRPALIIDEGGHTAWANSMALAMAGISSESPDPVPGAHFFQRDDEGVPTGWLVEGAAIEPVMNALDVVSMPALRKAAPAFLREMSRVGLTSAFDAGMIETADLGRQLALELAEQEALPVRIIASLYVNRPSDLETALERLQQLDTDYEHPYFDVNTLKLSLDGTVEAKTAVTLEPYVLPEGHVATPLLPAPEVIATVIEAAGIDRDLHLHAIGDGAVNTALNAVQAAREAYPKTASRFTICHIEVVNPADILRFAELNVVAQTTPTWFEYDYVALEYLGPERFEQLYPLASIRRNGAKVTLGSDYPVTWIGVDALNPMFNIEMAVTRQRAGDPDYPVQSLVSERLSVDQALRAHTVDAAWQIGLEEQIGTIEVGKLADIVVLERDPYFAPIHSLHEIRVDHTFSGGREVFKRRSGSDG